MSPVPEPLAETLVATWTYGNAPEPCLAWFGGDPSNPTWDEYVAEFVDEVKPALEAIRRCPESAGLIGSDMNNGYFALSDGRSVGRVLALCGIAAVLDVCQRIARRLRG